MAAQITTAPVVTAVNMKIAGQPKPVSSSPPISGPKVGTTTMTVATRPSIDAARFLSNRSRMMARLTTMAAEAVRQRSHHQLARGEREQIDRDGELNRGDVRGEAIGHLRQRRHHDVER